MKDEKILHFTLHPSHFILHTLIMNLWKRLVRARRNLVVGAKAEPRRSDRGNGLEYIGLAE
jgi:hypothetical protein